MRIGVRNIVRAIVFFVMVCGVGFLQQSMAAEKTGASTEETKKEVVGDPSYVIGPTDVLGIHVWKEPDFSRDVLVRPDGQITLPLIGDIQASGKTTLQLKILVAKRLKDFIDNPEVTVILLESHSKKFFIIGKVNEPGTYQLSPNMTVLQALSLAGGLAEWADKDSIRVIRRSGGKEEIIKFNYKKVISGKNLEQNILLKPYDTIVVP
jgi:polysaccharide biosynthesis/export protein